MTAAMIRVHIMNILIQDQIQIHICIPGTDTVENQGESVGNSVIEMIIRCPLCMY